MNLEQVKSFIFHVFIMNSLQMNSLLDLHIAWMLHCINILHSITIFLIKNWHLHILAFDCQYIKPFVYKQHMTTSSHNFNRVNINGEDKPSSSHTAASVQSLSVYLYEFAFAHKVYQIASNSFYTLTYWSIKCTVAFLKKEEEERGWRPSFLKNITSHIHSFL